MKFSISKLSCALLIFSAVAISGFAFGSETSIVLSDAERALQSEQRHEMQREIFRHSSSANLSLRASSGVQADSLGSPLEWMTALESVIDEGVDVREHLKNFARTDELRTWPLAVQVKFARLIESQGLNLNRTVHEVKARVAKALAQSEANPDLSFELMRSATLTPGWSALTQQARLLDPESARTYDNTHSNFVAPTRQQLSDLYFEMPAIDKFENGKYVNSPRAFMFCRHSRHYPCRIVFRDHNNQPLRDPQTHAIWSQPSLGMSKLERTSDLTNGQTPQGVHLVDGVIQQGETTDFGRFPRVVLNFLPANDGSEYQKLVPSSSAHADWWKETSVAQRNGRSDLRMHGTLNPGGEADKPWHPFRPTAGCIAARENTYDGVVYRDQRHLLDAWMAGLGLSSSSENERQIHGLLYVIEMDEKEAPVSVEDLAAIGIQ